jgi:uncharacterized protein YgiM (DUF1202 family)
VKRISRLFQKETWMKGMLTAAAVLLVFTLNGFISEAAEGKVIAQTAKIRAEASTSSEVVGSTAKGSTVDIVGAVKDSSGTVWYKVPNGNNTYGYIRSDLIETTADIKVETASTTTTTDTAKPADTVPTSIGETQAVVAQDSVRIRSGASTAHDTVTSLTQGTAITLIGEATDSAGNKWYQMTCDKNGKTIEGYIRADLITIGEAASTETTEGGETAAEGENTEENGETEGAETEQMEEAAEPEHNDYQVVYNDDTYWLYDNTNGTMMSVTNLLEVVNQVSESNTSLQSQLKNAKIVIIILAVIVVLLIIAVSVLIFKLKDAYYYEYEEEEEEEIEEPEPPMPKKKKKQAEPEIEPEEVKKPARKQPREVQTEEAEITAAEKKPSARKTTSRKAQNFLLDDDEFEFEFLNMDDKDL